MSTCSRSTISFGPRFHPRTAPVTFWFIVGSALLTLLLFFGGAGLRAVMQASLAFLPDAFPARPWTLLTYPWLNFTDPFWFLLLGYVLWWVGSELEGWWGSRVQAGFLATVGVTTALALAVSSHLLAAAGPAGVAVGAGPLLCALFTVWCLRNPDREVLLIFVPVTGRVLLILEVAMMWWSYGPVHGLSAVLGSAGVAALYYYQGHRLHQWLRGSGKGGGKQRPTPQDRARDKKFRRIIEQSGLRLVEDEPEKKH